MKRKKRNIIVSVFIVILLGCLIITIIFFTKNDKYSGIDDIKNIFELNGYTFSSKSLDKDILQGERYNITLNNKINFYIFTYDSLEATNLDIERISSDGFSYIEPDKGKTSMIGWIATPHFYRYYNLIILYLGDDEIIINSLSNNFGKQIAGQ